ncbi:MAG TPA: hypothetical protein VGH37_14870 [Candidatus Acidoferrum sp.]|jgi:acetyl-CoA carboxylase carboxyltransferase component
MTERKIFDVMMEGIAAMKSHRESKLTLRCHKVEVEVDDTRRKPTQALDMLENKRDKNPPKKHGNIPL